MLMLTLYLLLTVVALVVVYVLYFSRNYGGLKKYGVEGPKHYPFVGNVSMSRSLFQQGIEQYQEYKEKKMYAVYAGGSSSIVITDLDMIRDILTRHFTHFPDRRRQSKMGKNADYMLMTLRGEHWKHVRSILSPTFSSGKLKRMSKLVESTGQLLVENLKNKMEQNEEVEMKAVMSNFTMDVIAKTAFGINLDSVKDPNNPFIKAAKKIIDGIGTLTIIFIFFPFIVPLLNYMGISLVDATSQDFFANFVDKAMKERRAEGKDSKHNDFLQLIVDAERENQEEQGENREKFQGLTPNEVQGQALAMILAGYDTVSTVMSFTIFLLATNPDSLKKVQEEIRQQLGSELPNYDNVSSLAYLEMCINESMRMYPPGFVLERLCVEDTEVQGFTFRKGHLTSIPVYAIHHDPAIWEDPEKFMPERFSPEMKETRHPYSFIPFGYGPRNCIGMRLALLELKIALASVLQKMTPVPCERTVYPITLDNMRLVAKDGLWLKMDKRQ